MTHLLLEMSGLMKARRLFQRLPMELFLRKRGKTMREGGEGGLW